MSYWYLFIGMGAGLISLAFAVFLFLSNKKIKVENEKVAELQGYIRDGANAFLKRQYGILAIFVAVVATIIALLSFTSIGIGWEVAICFVLGAAFNGVVGFFGMQAAIDANAKTTEAAQKSGMTGALRIAVNGGSVLGLTLAGVGLFGVSAVTFVFWWANGGVMTIGIVDIVTGLVLGACFVALFARVGGGIYTKAADVGADLVGKIEAGIPEDDHRNPATIADNVGDNVGDVAGMGADLFESYIAAIIGAFALAALGLSTFTPELIELYLGEFIMYPILVSSAGILTIIFGILFIKFGDVKDPAKKLRIGTWVAAGILLVASAILSWVTFKDVADNVWESLKPFVAVAFGLGGGIAVGWFTELFTSNDYKPVREIAKQSETGAGTNLITGLSVGMKSTVLPVITLIAVIIVSFIFAGFYGVALSAVGMLATVGLTIAIDAYGPIADNAGGIAEMAELPKEVREITDKLDAVGNTTAAVGKGFSVGSAALTSTALFMYFVKAFYKDMPAAAIVINIFDPLVVSGIFMGAVLTFLFSAFCIQAVGRAAGTIVEEVRRQFREKPGIMDDTEKPDYARCVDISTKAALKEMILPGMISFLVPIAIGIVFGGQALAGALAGSLVTGLILAIFMANAGGAWDNAKKYIEATQGKGTDTHKAAVVGDTVGDPLKDTSGPSIDILLILMNAAAVVFIPIFLAINDGTGLIGYIW